MLSSSQLLTYSLPAAGDALRVGWSGQLSSNSGDLFSGAVADLRVYNGTLTGTQVAAMLQPILPVFANAVVTPAVVSPGTTSYTWTCLAGFAGAPYTLSQNLPLVTWSGTSGMPSGPSCAACPPGFFSLAGASACTPCPAGSYGGTSGLTTSACSGPCSAGYSCPAITINATGTICPAGSYCLFSTGPALCPAGRYGSTTGLSAATCSGVCSAGAACPAGSTANVANSCAPGSYCVAGAAPAPCPAGTFGSSSGLSTAACSGPCSGGASCPAGSVANVALSCPAGYACAAGAAPVQCLPGTYSLGGAASCTNCAAGSFGSTSGLQSAACSGLCPAGSFAAAGAAACTPCVAGASCSGGATASVAGSCAIGSYCAAGAAPALCTAGYYGASAGLSVPTCTGPCSAGKSCPAGSTSNTVACPAGQWCAAGVPPAPCAAGYFGSSTGLSVATCSGACSAGASCPAGSVANVAGSCALGYFCAAGAGPQLCPGGYYGATMGLSVSTCTGACPNGASCPAGSSAYSPGSCAAGFACATGAAPLPCPAGTYAAAGASACAGTVCSAGTYGPQMRSSANTCSAACSNAAYSFAGASACAVCPPTASLVSAATGCAPNLLSGVPDTGVVFSLSGSQAEGIAAFPFVNSAANVTFVTGPFGTAGSALNLAAGAYLSTSTLTASPPAGLPLAGTLSAAGWVLCMAPPAGRAAVIEWGLPAASTALSKFSLMVTAPGPAFTVPAASPGWLFPVCDGSWHHIALSSSFSLLSIPGLQLWLDSADAATIVNPAAITQWSDKSGKSNHAITGGGNATSWTSTTSGTIFNGGYMNLPPGAFPYGDSGYSYFVVATFGTSAVMDILAGGSASAMNFMCIRGSSPTVNAMHVP